MAACSALPLPLALLCLLLPTGGRLAAGGPPPSPPTEDPFLSTDDYQDQYPLSTEEPDTAAPTSGGGGGPMQRCDYDSCEEDLPPCQQLEANRGCLCPGLTPADVAPLPPQLRWLGWNGSQVLVRWCAPHSHVTGYRATVGGAIRGHFGWGQRSGGLDAVAPMEEVCLLAINRAGASQPACQTYRHQGGAGSRLALTLGLVGGALGLLLLLGGLVWSHSRQRRQQGGDGEVRGR